MNLPPIWSICADLAARVYYQLWYLFRARTGRSAQQWRFLHEELESDPVLFRAAATVAPRWNPHALIVRTGPIALAVGESVDVMRATLDATCVQWTLELVRLPLRRSLVSTRRLRGQGGDIRLIAPQAGLYDVVLRMYEPVWPAVAPPLRHPRGVVAEKFCQVPLAAFVESLPGRVHRGQRLRQHHLSWTLRSEWLPRRLRRYLVLPVGNPETDFRFGPLDRGAELMIRASHVSDSRVYVCLYDATSMPVCYGLADVHRAWSHPNAVGWVIRIHPANPRIALEVTYTSSSSTS